MISAGVFPRALAAANPPHPAPDNKTPVSRNSPLTSPEWRRSPSPKKVAVNYGSTTGLLLSGQDRRVGGRQSSREDPGRDHFDRPDKSPPVFQPLFYTKWPTSVLTPSQIATPIRGILRKQRNAMVTLGEVTGVDKDQKRVFVSDADRQDVPISYDYLILATGSTHSTWPQRI